jgi:hypothetical protein
MVGVLFVAVEALAGRPGVNGQVYSHPVLDISRSGMRLAGPAPAAPGATVDLTLDVTRVAPRLSGSKIAPLPFRWTIRSRRARP